MRMIQPLVDTTADSHDQPHTVSCTFPTSLSCGTLPNSVPRHRQDPRAMWQVPSATLALAVGPTHCRHCQASVLSSLSTQCPKLSGSTAALQAGVSAGCHVASAKCKPGSHPRGTASVSYGCSDTVSVGCHASEASHASETVAVQHTGPHTWRGPHTGSDTDAVRSVQLSSAPSPLA